MTGAHNADNGGRAVHLPTADDRLERVRAKADSLLDKLDEKSADASLRDTANAAKTLVEIEKMLIEIEKMLGGDASEGVMDVHDAREELARLVARRIARRRAAGSDSGAET